MIRDTLVWGDGTPIARHELAEPWGAVPSERWVRVVAEICTPGLWDVSGCARHPDGLPIPQALIARIAAWQEWYDNETDRNREFPKPIYWEQRADAPIAAFNEEGRAIGHALKEALPSDWTVIVVDVDAWCRPATAGDDGELILRAQPAK